MTHQTKLTAVGQKLKGKAQQAIGEYQMQTGHPVKGSVSKAKGKLNETIADAKMKMEKTGKKYEDSDTDEVII